MLTRFLASTIGSRYNVSVTRRKKGEAMGLFSSLSREQKESIGLLQIGTFLEYFDLMLYIHMGVLLNDIFFPKTDPHTASLLAAFLFCSTYVFRPVGALIFGWLGDNIGRKSTIVLTTTIMSISCLLMANLPTYSQIGITATWIMTFCRMAQGMSSMGEIVGANIYFAETIQRPASYPIVASTGLAAELGALVALGVATLVTTFYLDWRLAFWIGAVIAIVGAIARTRLRETPEFLEMKRQQIEEANKVFEEGSAEKEATNSTEIISQHKKTAWKKTIENKTIISYFFIYCGFPITFYLAFMYFNPLLIEKFGYSPADIIKHNFCLSGILVVSYVFWISLTYRIHPIKIIKLRGIVTLLLMICLPILIIQLNSPYQVFLTQALILLIPLESLPAEAVLIYHLPIWRRFTYATFLYAIARATMYVVTSFGLVYLGIYFGHFGLWFITLPVTGAYLYGIRHFENLERQWGMFRPNNLYFKTDLLKKGWLKQES